MSQVLINQYRGELDRLKKVGGMHRESSATNETRFADYKKKVFDRLASASMVSAGTIQIVDAMREVKR